MTDNETVDKQALEELLVRWSNAAQYAKNMGNIHEYDGIMGCHDELQDLIQDNE